MSEITRAPHAVAFDLCGTIARALDAVLPAGFRGHLEVVVDGDGVQPYDVAVKFRPPQPRAGMAGGKMKP